MSHFNADKPIIDLNSAECETIFVVIFQFYSLVNREEMGVREMGFLDVTGEKKNLI